MFCSALVSFNNLHSICILSLPNKADVKYTDIKFIDKCQFINETFCFPEYIFHRIIFSPLITQVYKIEGKTKEEVWLKIQDFLVIKEII